VFERDGQEIRISWSTEPMARVTYETRSPLTIVDIVGDERTVPPTDGVVSLLLTQNPVYVKGPVHEVREQRSQSILAWAEQDFSNVQGAGGWYYGYYDGDGKGDGDGIEPTGPYTDDDFEPLAPVEDAWGQYWGDRQLGPIKISADGAHPSAADGRAVWAVRRWVSDVTGTVHIAGSIARGDEGDGTRAKILVDGTEVFSANVGGPDGPKTLEYAIDPVVKKGSLIDFAVTPGPGTDINLDATTFTALITLPIVAASEQDFGMTQGLNGWYYGYYDGDGKGESDGADLAGPYTEDDFERLTPFDDGAVHDWRAAGLQWLKISRSSMHPSVSDGRAVWPVRRWISDVDGKLRITGSIARGAECDGTRAKILVDGTEVFSADVGGPDGPKMLEYEVFATVQKGSLIDFALTPGPGLDINFDATAFTATMQRL
jgi:hypothetical protein